MNWSTNTESEPTALRPSRDRSLDQQCPQLGFLLSLPPSRTHPNPGRGWWVSRWSEPSSSRQLAPIQASCWRVIGCAFHVYGPNGFSIIYHLCVTEEGTIKYEQKPPHFGTEEKNSGRLRGKWHLTTSQIQPYTWFSDSTASQGLNWNRHRKRFTEPSVPTSLSRDIFLGQPWVTISSDTFYLLLLPTWT